MPLLKLLDKQPELLRDALVVDKIIGKAAAMLLTLGGVKEIHTYMLSQNGRAFLERHHIPVTAQCDIDMIQNRQKDGICPFEKSVLDTEDLEEAYARLKATARRLMASHRSPEGRKGKHEAALPPGRGSAPGHILAAAPEGAAGIQGLPF